jgi:hypothetical protein
MVVEPQIEQARKARQVSEGQRSGCGSILPHQNARTRWKKWTEQEYQKVQVRHAGQDYVGLDAADEPEQPEGRSAHSSGSEGMDVNPERQRFLDGIRLCNHPQVQLVFVASQASRQQSGYLFRAAAAKMRNQQKDPGSMSHGFYEAR